MSAQKKESLTETSETALHRELTGQEDAEAFRGPSLFCNKIALHITPITGRLTFMELSNDGKANYRTSVTLGIADLIELQKLIERMISGRTKEIPVRSDNG